MTEDNLLDQAPAISPDGSQFTPDDQTIVMASETGDYDTSNASSTSMPSGPAGRPSSAG